MQFHRVPTNVENIGNKILLWTYMYTTIKFLGKHLMQTNLSKFDERLFSALYLCRLRLKQGREMQDFMLLGREFQRDTPAKDTLVLNKSSLDLRT